MAGKEINLLKETADEDKRVHESDIKRNQDKLEATESSLQQGVVKARESEQLNKSLKAVLREKEDSMLDLENDLVQKQQEVFLLTGDLQRRSSRFDEDCEEHLTRIRLLEAAAVKARGHIAESDASNLLKDELLASALSKQVTVSDETRQMRAILDTQHGTTAASLFEIEELRASLTKERKALEESRDDHQRLLRGEHHNVLAELANAQEAGRLIEEEMEVTRSELRGATIELVAFKESLDSAGEFYCFYIGNTLRLMTCVLSFKRINSIY